MKWALINAFAGRHAVRCMVLASFIALAALLLGLLWGANGVDKIARETQETVVAKGLDTRFAELAASVVPQADWDDAVSHLDNHFDKAWATANVGAFLTQTSGFELAGVLDASDQPVFAVRGDTPLESGGYAALRNVARPLVEQVRRAEARRGRFAATSVSSKMISRPIQASGVSRLGGQPYLFTATLVQPDFGTALPKGDRSPIILVGEAIDSGFLAKMSERYRLRDARLVSATSPIPKDAAVAGIADVSRRPLLVLRWTPERPGWQLLRQTFGIGAGAALLFAICVLLINRTAQRALAELVRNKQHLAEALAASQSATVAKSEFLASMSHEIRTPLNGVIGALHLLRAETLSKPGETLLASALASGEMVNELINDILDLSKIEAGQMELSPVATDLGLLLNTVAGAFAGACQAKGLTLDLELGKDMGWACVDPLRLRQCLFNLVGNAVKFTDAGVVRVTAWRPEAAPEILHIEVSDTGIGISAEAQTRLFQRFSQADGSTSRRYGGAGLGLAITKHLAERMGGGISVVSRPGAGSAFSLTLRAPIVARAAAASEAEAAEHPLQEVRILLVDDNASNRLVASTMLERLGAEVFAAESGQAAIDCALAAPFDLILMDIQMPEMDGMEATRRLRANPGANRLTPIIALTANVLSHQRAAYEASGMQGVVSKPISPRELLGEISRVVEAESYAQTEPARTHSARG